MATTSDYNDVVSAPVPVLQFWKQRMRFRVSDYYRLRLRRL